VGEGLSETDISREIREALTKSGWRCERINSGKVKVNGGWMHLAQKGFPDTLVMKPGKPGVVGFLETKTDVGHLNEWQIAWHAWAVKSGFNVATVRSRSDALAAVKGWS
jgi:hypothetical protein